MAQNLKDSRSDNRGGLRQNAGRKKGNKKSVSFRLTDTEEIKMRKYLDELRKL